MCKPWFKIYRELDHHEIIRDHSALAVFMHILCNVDDDGCMTTGRIKGADHLGLTPSTFRYILHEKLCKKWEIVELTLAPGGKYTNIRVKNWHKYQDKYAERALDGYQSTKGFDTKSADLPANSLTQEDSLKNDDGLTQESQSITPTLTQDLTQTLDTSDRLKTNDSSTQVSNENLTQKLDTESEDIYTEKENNNSSYEELEEPTGEGLVLDTTHGKENTQIPTTLSQPEQQAPTLEGEIVTTPKANELSKPKAGQNPDGSYGNQRINRARIYFLKAQDISSEDCTRNESGIYWNNLLRWIDKEVPDLDCSVSLEKFIDCLVSGVYIDPSSVTSGKKLWYRRNELMKKIRERKARSSKSTNTPKATYGNVVGGIAW